MRIKTTKAKPVDPEELDDRHGEFLVKLARESVEHFIATGKLLAVPEDVDEVLLRPGAAFVTIESLYGRRGEKELRGCIGTISPVNPLAEAVVRVAVDAAFRDPRFPPMTREELDSVVFEVSVLSRMKLLGKTPKERLNAIRIGRDGLLIVRGPYQGLLLPQVPLDYGWNEIDFLNYSCIKAGLPPNCWLDPNTLVYKFTTVSWREEEPRGKVIRVLGP